MGTTNYTGTATNHATITLPDDAGYQSAGIAAFNTPLEELKDLIEYHEDQIALLTVAYDRWSYTNNAVNTTWTNTSFSNGAAIDGTLPELTIANCLTGDLIEVNVSAHFIADAPAAGNFHEVQIAVEEDGTLAASGCNTIIAESAAVGRAAMTYIYEVSADCDITARIRGKISTGAGTSLSLKEYGYMTIKRMRQTV